MTDDIIKKLRFMGTKHETEAADALEAQAKRIAELEFEVFDLNESLTIAYADGFERGKDAARAALEKK